MTEMAVFAVTRLLKILRLDMNVVKFKLLLLKVFIDLLVLVALLVL